MRFIAKKKGIRRATAREGQKGEKMDGHKQSQTELRIREAEN